MQDSQYETGRFIVISMGHMTREDSDVLTAMDDTHAPAMVAPYKQGFVISTLPGATDSGDLCELATAWADAGLSESFIKAWKWARNNGYGLVQFDADGSHVDCLDVHNW